MLVIGCVVGVWHALPLTNIVNDEMYFVGGVFRALQQKSIFPLPGDVPYGTITFWSNYFVFSVLLAGLFAIFRFQVSIVKEFVVQHVGWMYVVPRLVSAGIAIGLLFFVRDILRRIGLNKREQLSLLVILFTNLTMSAVLHTGKVWVLSTSLVVISIGYLLRSINTRVQTRRNIFCSILTAFLAFANFPLCGFALIVIPLLIWFHRHERRLLLTVVYSVICSIFVSFFVFLANSHNIITQVTDIFTAYHPLTSTNGSLSTSIGFWRSLGLHAQQVVSIFPLSILLIVVGFRNGVRHKSLMYIASAYACVYFLLITILVTWTNDSSSNIRYLFPLGFFLIFIVAAFRPPNHKWLYVLGGISLIPYFLFLYHLSVPTTYNEATSWILAHANKEDVVVINQMNPILTLPKNAKSYSFVQEKFCATICQEALKSNLNSEIKFFLLDSESIAVTTSQVGYDVYRVSSSTDIFPHEKLIKTFVTGAGNPPEFDIDYNIGSYFDWRFYTIRKFGKGIYIYHEQKN
ncbi:MAG: hypothetical protein WCK01_01740 [Candidatus Uhrbacteria bacterium]